MTGVVTNKMTSAQFAALAALLRLRSSSSAEAARLVLVEELDKPTAAARCGITTHSLYQCLASCERGRALARIVDGIHPTPDVMSTSSKDEIKTAPEKSQKIDDTMRPDAILLLKIKPA